MRFFINTKIIYGDDGLKFIEKVLGTKCFIITDENLVKLGILDLLTDTLKEYGKDFKVFSEVEPNPHEDTILKARELCMTYKPEIIFGFGGGSSMDTAKAVRALYEFPNMTLKDLNPFNDQLMQIGKKTKLIAIPTTSGTGAETSWVSVISRIEKGYWRKLMIAHKSLTPDFAILNSKFTIGMPPKLTAVTAFDATAHSFESLISRWRNDFTDALCYKAIELIFKFLPIAYKNPDNKEAREKMQEAATIAGMAFSNSQVIFGHSMGHAFGVIFKKPHGMTVGLFLPYVLQYCLNNPDENDKTIAILGKNAKLLGFSKWDTNDKEAANILIDKIIDLKKLVGIPLSIKELGISREKFETELDMLIDFCLKDDSIKMSPRRVDQENLRKLYLYAYEGKNIDF